MFFFKKKKKKKMINLLLQTYLDHLYFHPLIFGGKLK